MDADKRLIEVIELYKDTIRGMGFMETVPPGHTWGSWTLYQLDNLQLSDTWSSNPHVQRARDQVAQDGTFTVKELWDRYLSIAFVLTMSERNDYLDRLSEQHNKESNMSNATVETIASDYVHKLTLPNGETIYVRGSNAATTTSKGSAERLSQQIKASVGL